MLITALQAFAIAALLVVTIFNARMAGKLEGQKAGQAQVKELLSINARMQVAHDSLYASFQSVSADNEKLIAMLKEVRR